MAAAALVGVLGVWLLVQATAGRLGGRILSRRADLNLAPAAPLQGLTDAPTFAGGALGSTNALAPGAGQLATWGNVTLRADVLGRARAMIEAAARDGITLKVNSSYRSASEQVALRRKNCGTSDYDVYRKPSGQCSPPTAIPGTSNHERGLALDINVGDRTSREFRWLAANAARYGFHNLPSEPWHWSVDGN